MSLGDKIMDVIMGRESVESEAESEEQWKEYMEVNELPQPAEKPTRKPTQEEVEIHLKKEYGIELIDLPD